MKNNRNALKASIAAALLASLAACGGGGGGSGGGFPFLPGTGNAGTPAGGDAGTGNPGGGDTPAALAKLEGIVATGAAFAGAAVTVTDQTGATVCTTTTNPDGTFSCTLPETTKAPLVIRATRDDQSLYSTTASAASGTTNVTPLTTIVVAQLSPDGNPASLAGAIQTQPDLVTATSIQDQVTELVAALQPLLEALGQGTIDLMSGAFAADGTGQDKLLDSISVSVLPNGSTANIEITVKTVPTTEGAAPVSIVFNTSTPTPTLPAVAASDLATDFPTPAAVAALLERWSACYALPLTQRVGGAGATSQNGISPVSDTANAIGTAANVIAPACKTLFVNDTPVGVMSNGYLVGRDAGNNGSFAGFFRSGATGVTFDRGNVEFARSAAGEFVLSYRSTTLNGGVDNETVIARNVNGELKLTGNGYAYRVTLRPYSEDRELVNAPAFSSFNTGYNVSIDNKLAGGSPIFSKVEVGTPFGTTLYYYPSGNLSFLSISKDGTSTPSSLMTTSIARLAGTFQNATTPGTVSAKETSIYYAQPEYTEAEISAIPNQSVWTVKFFLQGSTTADATQTYRTISRAQTLDEIRQLKFAQLTDVQRAEMIAGSSVTGRFTFGAPSPTDPNVIDFSSEGNLDAWTVPLGALAPTSLSVQGSAPGTGPDVPRFNDGTGLSSTQRKGIIYCSSQGPSDPHCDSGFPGQYANGSSVNLFDLWVRNSRQVEISKKVRTNLTP